MGHALRAEPPLDFDEDGFLTDPYLWNEEVAKRIAEEDGIGDLTDAHWQIIRYLREHYLRFGSLPVMRLVCRANHLKRDSVRTLFNGCREAWRISGLPNPGEEAKAYM